MDLYFLRHGKAEEPAADRADHERRLVGRGVADATLLAELLVTAGITFDAVYTSPYPRAAETARIVATSLALTDKLFERPELASGRFGMGGLQTLVSAHRSNSSLLFVGHEPDLSYTIEQLCGAVCEMKTASLACVTTARPEPNQGVLRWLLPPKILRPTSTGG